VIQTATLFRKNGKAPLAECFSGQQQASELRPP
jgi:hypothetical protein